jgi:hypothetical protein
MAIQIDVDTVLADMIAERREGRALIASSNEKLKGLRALETLGFLSADQVSKLPPRRVRLTKRVVAAATVIDPAFPSWEREDQVSFCQTHGLFSEDDESED